MAGQIVLARKWGPVRMQSRSPWHEDALSGLSLRLVTRGLALVQVHNSHLYHPSAILYHLALRPPHVSPAQNQEKVAPTHPDFHRPDRVRPILAMPRLCKLTHYVVRRDDPSHHLTGPFRPQTSVHQRSSILDNALLTRPPSPDHSGKKRSHQDLAIFQLPGQPSPTARGLTSRL